MDERQMQELADMLNDRLNLDGNGFSLYYADGGSWWLSYRRIPFSEFAIPYKSFAQKLKLAKRITAMLVDPRDKVVGP